MFTGIITHQGIIDKLTQNTGNDLLLTIRLEDRNIPQSLTIGSSVACAGICLTLVKKIKASNIYYLDFQASAETLDKTTISDWKTGDKINIEFALKLGDELGGHMVSGHIDAVAEIKSINKINDSHQFIFNIPDQLIKFICPKGSIVINGVSLTVNEVWQQKFSVNIIAHTFNHTNFDGLKAGDKVNLEIDLIARYLERLANFSKSQ
jgi:riboflavin synthase